ncbi:MAG: phosphoribosyl-AMP cyclohydrolase [Lentisphaeria bacterium]|nr:phosphoribosyl-AMP cyclohydrolase [Lentisphaeria bacterium]
MNPDFEKFSDGLVPAIAQDYQTGEVLMMAYMNEESWNYTLESGNATYWSRSRGKLWKKGESSGNVQIVKQVFIDCDADTILIKVEQVGGAACHTGRVSCFYHERKDGEWVTISEPLFDPAEVYKK